MNKQENEKAIGFFNARILLFKKALDFNLEEKQRTAIETEIKADELAISALRQQLNNGWIPIDNPPTEYGTYTVAWRPAGETAEDVMRKTNSDCTHYYETLEYDPDDEAGWIESIQQCDDYIILAWRPLPLEYKEVSE